MAALVIETPPAVEPVSLAQAKNFLRVEIDNDDDLISGLITTAREACESFTGRSFVPKQYRQALDSFPYFTDSIMSQMAYPPSYYALPRYSTTLWNYSQMIKLFAPPLIAVQSISYLSTDQQWHSLTPAPPIWYPDEEYAEGDLITDGNGNVQMALNAGTSGDNPPTWAKNIGQNTNDTGPTPFIVWQNQGAAPAESFIVDADSAPARLFPGPAGSFWPQVMYVPNAVQIHFTAGYPQTVFNSPMLDTDLASGVPGVFKTAIFQLVSHWYENREPVGTGTELPDHVKWMLWTKRILDYQPTRG